MPNLNKPLAFIFTSLVVLFMPGVGDFRFAGLFAFIYIGLPWLILALKDKVEYKQAIRTVDSKPKLHSIFLLLFGLLAMFLGVGIDLFVLYGFYSAPNIESLLTFLIRLLMGVPFFGFGVYLVYLSLGIKRA